MQTALDWSKLLYVGTDWLQVATAQQHGGVSPEFRTWFVLGLYEIEGSNGKPPAFNSNMEEFRPDFQYFSSICMKQRDNSSYLLRIGGTTCISLAHQNMEELAQSSVHDLSWVCTK